MLKEQVAKIYSLLLWGNKWGYSSRPTFRRLRYLQQMYDYFHQELLKGHNKYVEADGYQDTVVYLAITFLKPVQHHFFFPDHPFLPI